MKRPVLALLGFSAGGALRPATTLWASAILSLIAIPATSAKDNAEYNAGEQSEPGTEPDVVGD